MKYKIVLNYYLYILIYLIILLNKVKGEDVTIQILVQQPVVYSKSIYDPKDKFINNYINEIYSIDDNIHVNLNFTYYIFNIPIIYNAALLMKDPKYDIIIIDDRFLFSEESFIESALVKNDTLFKDYYLKNFVDLTDYVNMTELSFNNPKILEDGIINGRLYGIPYEFDFNVLYYNKIHPKLNKNYTDFDSMKNIMKSITWDEFIKGSPITDGIPLDLGFLSYDFALDLFVEYISNDLNIDSKLDPKFYENLYTDKAERIYTNFKNLITENYNMTLSMKKNEASCILYFYMNNTYPFYKGLMSDNIALHSYQSLKKYTFNYTLPPKYSTVVNKKYLVINKHSSIKLTTLVDVALKLSSKRFQILKAKNFYTIPTFDISKRFEDEDIKEYCDDYPEICTMIEEMKGIHIKDVFKSKSSTCFFEVRYYLSYSILLYLYKYLTFEKQIGTLSYIIKNIFLLKSSSKEANIYNSIVYTLMVIFIFIYIYVIYLIRKYRKYFALKVLSPVLCIFIIVGFTLQMIVPIFKFQTNSIIGCKLIYIVEPLSKNLVYIPMIAITLRIYFIYSISSIIGKKLNNFHMIIYIMTVIIIWTGITSYIYVKDEYEIYSARTILQYRFPACEKSNHTIYYYFSWIYTAIVV